MRKLFLTLIVAMLTPCAWAATLFTMGNFIYEVSSEPSSTDYGTCSVYGLSNEGKNATSLTLPSTAWNSGKGYYVKSINQSAFKDQKNIKDFSAHYSLTTINPYAFQGCSSLEKVWLPSSMYRIYGYVFDGCTKLKQVYLASPTPMLGGWFTTTFPANSGMYLYIGPGDPNGIYKYKNSTQGTDCSRFAGVYKSMYACDTWYEDGTQVRVTKAATKSTNGEFAMIGFDSGASGVSNAVWRPKPASSSYDYACNDLYYNLTSIIDSACTNNTSIKCVDLDYLSKVKTIGAGAFRGCTAMTYAYLKAETVGSNAFRGCTSLAGAYVRDVTKTVGDRAFFGCTNLTTINVYNVTSWNSTAVADCPSFTSYTVGSGNTNYSVENGVLFNKAKTTLISYPCGLDYNTSNIPFSVTAFGQYSFYTNQKITSVSVPWGVTSIGYECFWNASNLSSIWIPSSVTSIGSYAFENCTKLSFMNVNMTTPVNTDNYMFSGAASTITYLYVPRGKVEDYKNAGWTRFTNYNYNGCVSHDINDSYACYNVFAGSYNAADGITYDGQLSIVGGSLTKTSSITSFNIPASLSYRGKKYAVSTISYDAFSNNSKSFTVSGCTNVRYVYDWAFQNSGVTSVALPNCLTVFQYGFYKTKLTSISLPKATRVSHYSFAETSALKSASLPEVTEVGTHAFENSTLTSVTLPKCTKLEEAAFQASKLTSISLPKCTSMGAHAFDNCTSITSASIPSLTDVPQEAFDENTALKSVTFGPNLKTIGKWAFYNSAIDHDIILPYGFKQISGSGPFYNTPIKAIKIPSSVTSLDKGSFNGMKSLRQLYINKKLNDISGTTFEFTDVPTSCTIRVPVGQATYYKGNTNWKRFSDIRAGSYDFAATTWSGSISNAYHFTVVSNASVTKGGTTYDGMINYVYNPNLPSQQLSGTYCSVVEYDMPSGQSQKKYVITAVGDSALASCTSPPGFSIGQYTDTIKSYAFYNNTGLTTFTVPEHVKYVGRYAFVGCTKLKELFFEEAGRSWNSPFYGGNASDFVCYVKHSVYYSYYNSVKDWSTISPSTKAPVEQLNGWLQLSSSNPYDFSIYHPVDFNSSGLEAYVVYNYDSSKKQANMQQVMRAPENTGVILAGVTANKLYKLKRPTSSVSAPNNLLIGTADGVSSIDVHYQNVGYYFNAATRSFKRPSSTYYVSPARAYLKLGSALAGSTTEVSIDLWPQIKVGDVNGDGEVGIADLTLLVDLVMKGSSNPRSDLNNDGETGVADVTKLVSILMAQGS